MGLFRSQEEREDEARRRAEEERAAQAAAAERTRLAQEAAFHGSPVGRARAAFARGDRFFQVEIEVSALTGVPSMFGSSDNEVSARAGITDELGRIEDEGWRLEHAGYVFVQTGSTSTEAVIFGGEGTVTRGGVVGVYLFRRAAPGA